MMLPASLCQQKPWNINSLIQLLFYVVDQGNRQDLETFVQNWVNELTSTELWKHCSGKNNPADLPSCGLTHHLSYVSQSA